jgi:predicted Zn-dependent protease
MALLSLPNFARAQEAEFRLLKLDGSHVRWAGTVNGDTVVTYSVLDRAKDYPGTRNCGSMDSIAELGDRWKIRGDLFRQELRKAFDLWERAANLKFIEVGDPAEAGIVIGAQRVPIGRAFTDVSFKLGDNPYREITRSLICLNPHQPWKIGFDGNRSVYDLRYTLAHEIGHAIGLDHPAVSHGQVMSFRYQEGLQDLQGGDITGALRLYGGVASVEQPRLGDDKGK